MDELLALLAKRAGRRLDHSRIAYDRINHWKKLARVGTDYIWHHHCLVHIFKFISVVDACFFANSSRVVDLVVSTVYTRNGVTWRPPEQPCLGFLRQEEHKLWAYQRGLFIPDQDESDDDIEYWFPSAVQACRPILSEPAWNLEWSRVSISKYQEAPY